MRAITRRNVGIGLATMALANGTPQSSASPATTQAAEGPHALMQTRRLRILCLHGYHGSGAILRRQMAPWPGELASLTDFVYIDAPSLAAGDFGWWHAVDAEQDPASDDPGVGGPHRHYKGWARTRAAIVKTFEEQGPFDGVLGFSQGAALAGLLVGLRAPDGVTTAERPIRFDFAIVVSGFASNDRELARLYDRSDAYNLPSLHAIGRADGIVPSDDSRRLASRFRAPVIVEHGGGHLVPGAPDVVARVRAFLEARTDGSNSSVPLWPGRSSPAMRVVFPRRPRGARSAALVVFRGGAYATSQGSGAGAAEWAAENGMVGVEVPYRCRERGDAFPACYVDAARALRIVRDRADDWRVDRARVGTLGFSAGGHLASLLSTQPSLDIASEDDLAPRISARPDFVILAYPLISFVEGYAPGAFVSSTENFFGRQDVDEATRRRFSNELHVTREHPPTFVWTTADDTLVPADHSSRFVEACERAGVPVRFELFAHGPHGMGLATGDRTDVGTWTKRALAWLRERRIIDQMSAP
jgi:acetyl esterase/lipase/predicted esterase